MYKYIVYVYVFHVNTQQRTQEMLFKEVYIKCHENTSIEMIGTLYLWPTILPLKQTSKHLSDIRRTPRILQVSHGRNFRY